MPTDAGTHNGKGPAPSHRDMGQGAGVKTLAFLTQGAIRVLAPSGSRGGGEGSRPRAGVGARLNLPDPMAPGVPFQKLGAGFTPPLPGLTGCAY